MSIFHDMHPLHAIESNWHFRELERMLSEAIDRGFVQEIPESRRPTPTFYHVDHSERWFIDYESGDIYSLHGPGERSCGYWHPIDPEELPLPPAMLQ